MATLTFAADERARVPFALVGVVLLVTSATFAAGVGTRPAPVEDTRASLAVERATATARTVAAAATREAARAAAARPLVDPANTTFGRVLNDSRPFRDYLATLVHRRVGSALRDASVAVGGVEATVVLPRVDTPAELARAIQRVDVEAAPAAPRLRVTIRDASVRIERGGRVVGNRSIDLRIAVDSPVLVLHDRVSRFQRRLDASPLEPGLAGRLTRRLYAVAYARGLAQYRGAPIGNVIANRHVELLANGALLDVQRETLGRSDPDGRAGLARATAATGLQDVLAATDSGADRWVDRVLGSPATTAGAGGGDGATRATATTHPNSSTLTVGVNQTADQALVTFRTGGGSGPSLADVIDDVYEADVRLVTDARVVGHRVDRRGVASANATLIRESTDARTTVESVEQDHQNSTFEVGVPPGFHRLTHLTRRVTVAKSTERVWRTANGTRTTTIVDRTTHDVTLALVGRHAATEFAPGRPIATAHEPGGPLGSRNFEGVTRAARERLIAAAGGPEAVARAVVAGASLATEATVDVEPPAGVLEWVYRDLAVVRDEARNVSFEMESAALLDADPAARLVSVFEEHRDSLVRPPARYDSVEAKVRVAARTAFLDAVGSRLVERARSAPTIGENVESELARFGVPTDRLTAHATGALDVLSAPRGGDPSGPLTGVDGSPRYLTLGLATPEHDPGIRESYYPLVAGNTAQFSVPYADAADGLVASLLGAPEPTVNLRTAAQTLRATNRSLARRANETLLARRSTLRAGVARALSAVRSRLQDALTDVDGVRPRTARAAVERGLGRYSTIHRRALAAANGSLAGAVAGSIRATDVRRDWIATRLRVTLVRARTSSDVRVAGADVRSAARSTRRQFQDHLSDAVASQLSTAVDRAGRRGARTVVERELSATSAVPSGLPLAPLPGYWYATTNVWTVSVEGSYARFVASAPASTPAPSPTVDYVRRDASVELDVDGDGTADRLGRNARVSFAVETAVVVIVPPGGTGVGDRTRRDERSAGWPG